ncbi:MAG: MotA/TolQ/ExbB proton channel family protein [Chthoniobacterales bacterium]
MKHIIKSPKLLLTLAILSSILAFSSLPAQDDATAEPATTAEVQSTPKKEMTLLQMLKVGGWTMWPLGLCSIAGIALTIWNALAVRPTKMLDPAVVNDVNKHLRELDVHAAKTRCEATPCLIANVMHAGFERVDREVSVSSIEKGMEEAAVEEIGSALVPINYISAVAVVAPMLGLLGTVSGMIRAFRAMALGGMGRPELLADNISEALITTATGLIIGIPTMVAYLYFKNRFTTIVASLNRITGNTIETLTVAIRNAQQGNLPQSSTSSEPTQEAVNEN